MNKGGQARFSRVFGDEAVLARLEKLGKNLRTFDNLVTAGFPARQLDEARRWHIQEAATPVERHAGERMTQGFFEDEALLSLYCRFYECTDWKLERSPWFFSREDYRRCFRALVDPLAFHVERLEEGKGEERWGSSFQKLPFDLGMERALTSLWEEIGRGKYYWSQQATYGHLRAANILGYLSKSVDIHNFSPHQYHYNWERSFRRIFEPALRRFREALEQAVRRWGERRRERTAERFYYRAYDSAHHGVVQSNLRHALTYFGLEPATASLKKLQSSFRKLSKSTHPDHGGTPEDFRKLAEMKNVVESWLKND